MEADGRHEGSTRWVDLFTGGRLPIVFVLAGGTLLYAMNMYFTAALMPTIVEDIGGARHYSWVIIGFVLAAILGTVLVDRCLEIYGARGCYSLAFLIFGVGAIANALSANIEMLVIARVAQGLGGGILAGLGYAVIRSVIPQPLWARATGITVSMWGMGALVGPLLGGVFGEFGAWRWAYGSIAAVSIFLILLAWRSLPGRGAVTVDVSSQPLPIASLAVLMVATLTISLSSFVESLSFKFLTIGTGVFMLVVFTIVERNTSASLLPAATYVRGNPLKWIYLTAGLVFFGVMVENFTPLFAQNLGGLTPLLASIFGAVLSAGWVIAQMLIVSMEDPARRNLAIRIGPVFLAVGLAIYGALQTDDVTVSLVVLWFVALFVAGVGIGIAHPFLSVAAMSYSPDAREGRRAAAGLATTQTIALAVSSALSAVFMSLGGADLIVSAQYLVFGLAVFASIAIVTAYQATK